MAVTIQPLDLPGKALRPTQALEIGDEVLRVEGKWKSSKDVPTGLLVEFVRAGAVQTFIALEMSQRNAAAHLYICATESDVPADVALLDAEWRFSTCSDPHLVVTTRSPLQKHKACRVPLRVHQLGSKSSTWTLRPIPFISFIVMLTDSFKKPLALPLCN